MKRYTNFGFESLALARGSPVNAICWQRTIQAQPAKERHPSLPRAIVGAARSESMVRW